ncbi:hypothetical protein [Methylobacter sp.]|uniref:hypothetical protein n=1 Tax=Methylobacter sp. TaxID=2051955 RepID=UPI003DA63196
MQIAFKLLALVYCYLPRLFDRHCSFLNSAAAVVVRPGTSRLTACQLTFWFFRVRNGEYEGCCMQKERINAFRETSKTFIDELGSLLIEAFHYLALFVIGASVVWSAVVAYAGIYFKTSMMPVRCLIFIAITALADFRYTGALSGRCRDFAGVWISSVTGFIYTCYR